MSSAHDAHGASAHAHDDHDAFDGEPAQELSPGEPRTPAWLPAVGLVFFSCLAVYLLASGDATAGETAKAQPEAQAQVQAHAAAAAPAPAPAPAPGGGAAAPAGSNGIRKLSPEQIEEFKKRIEEAHAKEGGAPAAPGAAAPAAPAGKGLKKIPLPPGAKAPPAKGPARK